MTLAAAHPALSFVFSDFALLRNDAIEPKTKFQTAPDGWWDSVVIERRPEGWILGPAIAEASFRFHPFFPTNMALRRDLFWSLGGFDPRLRGRKGEDGVFTANALLHARVGATTKVSARVRKHAGNATFDQDSLGTLTNLLAGIANLRGFKETHPNRPDLFAAIDAEIQLRSVMAAEAAFATMDHAKFREIVNGLPPHTLGARLRVKRCIAAFPDPIGIRLNRILQRLRPQPPRAGD